MRGDVSIQDTSIVVRGDTSFAGGGLRLRVDGMDNQNDMSQFQGQNDMSVNNG